MPHRERPRILISDPDRNLLATNWQLLARDFDVDTASNVEEAVACLQQHTPDVLILEPEMSRGSGIEVLTHLSQSTDISAIAVMILTSCREVELLKSVAEFRISDYCVKPLVGSRLVSRVRFVLTHRRPLRAADGEGVEAYFRARRQNRIGPVNL